MVIKRNWFRIIIVLIIGIIPLIWMYRCECNFKERLEHAGDDYIVEYSKRESPSLREQNRMNVTLENYEKIPLGGYKATVENQLKWVCLDSEVSSRGIGWWATKDVEYNGLDGASVVITYDSKDCVVAKRKSKLK